MGARKRVTNHHGRIGTAKHNGRGFDLSHAPHIDRQKTQLNHYWFIGCSMAPYAQMDPTSEEYRQAFEDSELQFYKQQFGMSLKLQNDRYKADRHPERCRTMEQVIQAKNKQPVETILQIGDCEDNIDPVVFGACVTEYIQRLQQWSKEHGGCYTLINYAVHVDEASPHAHLRGTFTWWDENNIAHMGQDEALKRAGVDFPNPNKPKSRYNNRKMTFDSMLRDWWIEIAEAHGYEIEKEPIKGAEALPVNAYKQKREAEKAIKAEQARLRVEQKTVSGERQMLDDLVDKAIEQTEKFEKMMATAEKGGGPLVTWAKSRKLNKDGMTVWDLYQQDMTKRQAAMKKTVQQARERGIEGIARPNQSSQQGTDFSL